MPRLHSCRVLFITAAASLTLLSLGCQKSAAPGIASAPPQQASVSPDPAPARLRPQFRYVTFAKMVE